MSITDALSSALSALNAIAERENVTANNIANEITPGFVPTEANMSESVDGGVKVTLSQNQNSGGVDEAREMVNMIINKTGYEANISTLQTSEEMSKTIDKLV